MSANIWAALRIAISMMDQPELFQAASTGDLDLLMRAFHGGDVWPAPTGNHSVKPKRWDGAGLLRQTLYKPPSASAAPLLFKAIQAPNLQPRPTLAPPLRWLATIGVFAGLSVYWQKCRPKSKNSFKPIHSIFIWDPKRKTVIVPPWMWGDKRFGQEVIWGRQSKPHLMLLQEPVSPHSCCILCLSAGKPEQQRRFECMERLMSSQRWVEGWMNRMAGWLVNLWMDRWMDSKEMNELTDSRMDGSMDRCMDDC